MPDLDVDGSVFSFEDGWEVTKYDEWPYFRNVLNPIKDPKDRGLHGCDIVALHGDDLWLIEAKDYAYEDAKVPHVLVAVVAEKVMDTLAGLHAGTRGEHDHYELCRRAVRARGLYVVLRIDLPGAQPHAAKGRQAKAVTAMAAYRQALRKTLRRVVKGRIYVVTGREDSPVVPWKARWGEDARSAHLPGH